MKIVEMVLSDGMAQQKDASATINAIARRCYQIADEMVKIAMKED